MTYIPYTDQGARETGWTPAPPKDGDLCRILPDFKVEHHCSAYRDGVITDVRTGRIVRD